MKLHIGCGGVKKEGFVNVDVQKISGVTEVVADCRHLPFRDASMDRVESYHLIEHLPRADADVFIEECRRVLNSGIFVIECPDLIENVTRMLQGDNHSIHTIYGLQRNEQDFHHYGYDTWSLSKILKEHKFEMIFIGSGTDYHAADEGCLRIECVKKGG